MRLAELFDLLDEGQVHGRDFPEQRLRTAQLDEALGVGRVRGVHEEPEELDDVARFVLHEIPADARGDARPDSDVDLCLVSEAGGDQLKVAQILRRAIWDIRPKPTFTLVPITPERLREKQAMGDYFFQTVLGEGVPLAS